MICKACNQDKDLIDAHIVPKSLFMKLRGNSNHLDVLGSDFNGRKGRTFKGEYDKTILCYECDGVFQKCDNYAKILFVDRENEMEEIWKNSDLVGWELETIDYDLFKQFVLSVLWRASVSRRSYYGLISLGPHEAIIKKDIFGQERFPCTHYQFLVSRYLPDKVPELERTMLNPDSIKIEGVNFCRVFFLGYTIWVKVDKRPLPTALESLKIVDGEPLRAVARSYGSSKERNILLKLHAQLKI